MTLLQKGFSEALRLRGSVALGLPWIVRPGGVKFCGYFIYGHRIVGVRRTMHRNTDIWTTSDIFDPSR